jgi:hypothetical protein
MSLSAVYNADALKIRWHSVGLWPMKAGLVMLHVSRESLGAFVLLLIVVGICCSSAWCVGCGMCCGMSAASMLVDHLACLLARSSSP